MSRMNLRALVGMFLVFVLGAASCGIPRDAEPRAFDREEIPASLLPGTLPPPTPTTVVSDAAVEFGLDQIFMIGPDELLTPVIREAVTTPAEAIETLLQDTTPQEKSDGITTAIARKARIPQVDTILDLAIVHLAPGSLNEQNREQRFAFAQIVYTLTSLPNIDLVKFVEDQSAGIEGEPADLAVQTDFGTTVPGAEVGRDDYPGLAPAATGAPTIGFDLPTPVPEVPSADLAVWMYNESGNLIKVSRNAARDERGALLALFDGPTSEERDPGGITTAIPPDAIATNVETRTFTVGTPADGQQTTSIAFIDLGSGSLPPIDDGEGRLMAVAQIVFTLTDLIEVNQVVILIDGLPAAMPTQQGLSKFFDEADPVGLTRLDYSELAPGVTIAVPPGITPTPTPTLVPTPDADAASDLDATPEPTPDN